MATLLARLGRFSYRRARLVLVAWLLAFAAALGGGLALGGQTEDAFSIPGTESQEALDQLDALFPQVAGASAQAVVVAPEGASVTDAGIRVSLFIAPEPRQIEAALRLGAPVVELHTGEYAHATGAALAEELKRIADMAALAAKNGIEPHAGHGLTYENVQPIAAIPHLRELNIGHYLIGEAIFCGLETSVRKMRTLMDEAR